MLSKKKVNSMAKRLARLSFDEETGEIDLSRVRAIIKFIPEIEERVRYLWERQYLRFLENEWERRLLKIEYVGACDCVNLQRSIEQGLGRKLQLQVLENEELIAGLRISVGDYIWERSIRGDLTALRC
jgi:hypothetical protein